LRFLVFSGARRYRAAKPGAAKSKAKVRRLAIGRASQAEFWMDARFAQIYPAGLCLVHFAPDHHGYPCAHLTLLRAGLSEGRPDYQVSIARCRPLSICVVPSREPRWVDEKLSGPLTGDKD